MNIFMPKDLISGNKKIALYPPMNIFTPMDLISGNTKIALYTPTNKTRTKTSVDLH